MRDFQRPSNAWLCFFSLIWIVGAAGFTIHFALAGKYIGSCIMGVFGIAAAGLWFKSRVAAWVLIVFACAGILHALFNIGHLQPLRILTRLCWAGYSIFLLAEFLKGPDET